MPVSRCWKVWKKTYYAHSFTQMILKVITPRTQKNPQNPVNRCQNLGKGLAHKGKAP
jgi:hypothetical protein